MTLRDVGKTQEIISEILPAIQQHIDNDDIDSLVVVINTKKNNGIHTYKFIPPEANLIEWLGILELIKIQLLDGDYE
jgi:hypothetical protein